MSDYEKLTDARVAAMLATISVGPYGSSYRAKVNFDGKGWTREDIHPPYSTDIAAAWYVLEVLRDHFSNVVLAGDNGWGLSLGNVGFDDADNLYEKWLPPINAETAPMAICLAGLMALEAQQ